MAETPGATLTFYPGGSPDCGARKAMLPAPLPRPADDFNWRARDFDALRMAMLEELAARFPERDRWSEADLEVVLVELFAWGLDQLSDMLDRVSAEAYLETARRPDSVRRLLEMIGYDPVSAGESGWRAPEDVERLLQRWLREPHRMELARRAGPRQVHRQRRMVTVEDHARRVAEHPLVRRAKSFTDWNGAWHVVRVVVLLWDNRRLDDAIPALPEKLQTELDDFRTLNSLPGGATFRGELECWVEKLRMAGQEVRLADPLWVGIALRLSVSVAREYFQSEVRGALELAFGDGSGGFFEVGRLRFGEDLNLGDVMQTAMQVEGVESVCVEELRRVDGRQQGSAGAIPLQGVEIAVCDNDALLPGRGWLRIDLSGGLKG